MPQSRPMFTRAHAANLLLLVIGSIVLSNAFGLVDRWQRFEARFAAKPPVWGYRSIDLFGVVGGLVIGIAYLNS